MVKADTNVLLQLVPPLVEESLLDIGALLASTYQVVLEPQHKKPST